jgi:hypothetical protein
MESGFSTFLYSWLYFTYGGEMKLYCTNGEKRSDVATAWTASQKEARKCRNDMKDDGFDFVVTTPVEVPTTKDGLIAFLNEHQVVVEGTQ